MKGTVSSDIKPCGLVKANLPLPSNKPAMLLDTFLFGLFLNLERIDIMLLRNVGELQPTTRHYISEDKTLHRVLFVSNRRALLGRVSFYYQRSAE